MTPLKEACQFMCRFKLMGIRFGYPNNASPDPLRTYTFYMALDTIISDTKTFPGFACQALVLARQPARKIYLGFESRLSEDY
jgi:hypothetical protein